MQCLICKEENDEFAVTCRSCKAFLQNRVPNLDLFKTAWKVLESPRKVFHTIALAEHKNYSFVLFLLFGIALSFTGFWLFQWGTYFTTLLDLLPVAVGLGLVLGLLSTLLLTAIYHLSVKMVGGSNSLRNSWATLAYATTPIALTLILLLPIELMTFGMYLFTSNPHPYTLKPLSYVVLTGLDAVFVLWSLGLVSVGTMVVHRIPMVRAGLATLMTFVIFGGAFLWGAPYVTALW